MRSIISFLLLEFLCGPLCAGTILAVFAHPDDESTVGALLAKSAAEGHTVYLAILTSGQMGTANTDIPAGDQLGAAREIEARCSCQALGINEPFLLRFMDGSISDWTTIPKIRSQVRSLIERVKPDVLITWGPDGLTGHPDHRTASNVTTEVYQQRSKLSHKPSRLYYVAYPESVFANLPIAAQGFGDGGLVADEWITTEIDASAHMEQAANSVRCHETQWPPEQMERIIGIGQQVLGGKIYLRRALAATPDTREKTLFQ